MEHKAVGSGGVDCINFVHDPDKCQAVVNTVMNLRFS